ncbi:hypothetical protein CK203_113572 [Vitis vinifera]|uniref:Uncharacterized protein n=1 Tax=Vitis vinifera TaxID=29760 RepID=A0A438CAS7_VITVI|nr:hypothetical protein CK203_113572 [Vitis vinifera]
MHSIDFVEFDDDIHMLSWDDSRGGISTDDHCRAIDFPHYSVQRPFVLIPDVDEPPQSLDPLKGTSSQEKVKREDDEILSPKLDQSRDYYHSGGVDHMMMAGRATSIVFSDDDLQPEGSSHTSTTIALGYAPSDFGSSTQTVRAYDSTQMKVMGTLEIELLIANAIPSFLHQKVKFIHDDQVVMVTSVRDMFISVEPVLQISHSDDDLLLTEFTFEEVQTLEIKDFYRDFMAMSFDHHNSIVVLDMMRGMSYLPGMGLGRHQHGPSEFMAFPDHDIPFGLGFIPTELDKLLREGIGATDTTPSDGIIGGLSTTQEAELQRLIQQLRLSDGALGTSTSTLIAPPFPDHLSLMTFCFPDEIDEHGTFFEIGDIVDGTVPHDEYVDEMLAMSLSQIEEIAQLELASPFDLFGVSAIEIAEEIQTALLQRLPRIFVSHHDDVYDSSFMDLSIFDYLPVSRDIALSAPSSPTSQIFDIDDEIVQPDSDDDSFFDFDPDPMD